MNKHLISAAICAVSIFIGYKATDLHWQNKWSKAEAEAAQNQLNAVNEAVKDHNKKLSEMEQLNRDTENKLNAANTDSQRLNAVNSSLQQQFSDSLRRQCTKTNGASVTNIGAARATDQLVYSELFGKVTQRAIDYARIADENRLKGLACERAYAIVSGTKF